MNINTRRMKDSGHAQPAAVAAQPGRSWLHAALQPIQRMCTTRLNGQLGMVADIAVGVGLLAVGVRNNALHPLAALAVVLGGLLLFSFAEYAMHRWLFHGPAQIFQQGHLTHHQQPLGYDSLPFFLVPLAILALAGLLDRAAPTLAFLFAGAVATGYAAYGACHWVIHNVRFRNILMRRWAAEHYIHHCHADKNFGVTSPLWDIVLGTRYVPRRTRAQPPGAQTAHRG